MRTRTPRTSDCTRPNYGQTTDIVNDAAMGGFTKCFIPDKKGTPLLHEPYRVLRFDEVWSPWKKNLNVLDFSD